jgi:hypothetical protein
LVELPVGASGMLVRDCRRKEADRLVTRSDPGAVSLVAELRGHERRAVEELEQWKTRADYAKPLDSRFPRMARVDGALAAGEEFV